MNLSSKLALCILAVSILYGCATTSSGPKVSKAARPSSSSELCFHAADGSTFRHVDGVEVLLVTSGGIELLGVTSGAESLCIPKETLGRGDARVVLFCREGYFCGALRLDTSVAGRDLLSFNERTIVLAPFVIL